MNRLVLVLLLVITIFFSCKKDDPIINPPPVSPFELELFFTQDNDELIQLSWSDLSSFDSIGGSVFIYSLDSIPLDYFPPIGGPISLPFEGNLYFPFIEKNETQLGQEILPCCEKIYMRLYVVANGELLGSNNVEINSTKTKKIEGIAGTDLLLRHPTLPRGYFYDNNTQSMILYDVVTDEVITTVALDYPTTWQSEITFGNNGMGDEIYIHLGENKLYIFDANTLDEKTSMEVGSHASSILTNDKGWFAVRVNGPNHSLKIYNRSTLEAIDSFDISTNLTKMFFTSKSENTLLLDATFSSFHLIDLEDDGTIVFDEHSSNTFGVGNSSISFAHLSPDDQFLLSGGKVFNSTTFDLVHQADFWFGKDPLFSLDGEKILGAYPENSGKLGGVRSASFPSLESQKHFLAFLDEGMIFKDGNDYYLIGKSASVLGNELFRIKINL